MNKWSMNGRFIREQHPGYAIDDKSKAHASIHPASGPGRTARKALLRRRRAAVAN